MDKRREPLRIVIPCPVCDFKTKPLTVAFARRAFKAHLTKLHPECLPDWIAGERLTQQGA